MALLGEEQWLFSPPVPRDLEGVDIPSGLVTDLILRRLSVEGTSNIQNLSNMVKLPVPVVHAVFNILRQQQLIEVKGMVGNDYRITLSRTRARRSCRAFSNQPLLRASPCFPQSIHRSR